MTPLHPEPAIPALSPPSHRSEELQGSRLLRDAAAAETAQSRDSDTESLGTGQGWGQTGTGCPPSQEGLGG